MIRVLFQNDAVQSVQLQPSHKIVVKFMANCTPRSQFMMKIGLLPKDIPSQIVRGIRKTTRSGTRIVQMQKVFKPLDLERLKNTDVTWGFKLRQLRQLRQSLYPGIKPHNFSHAILEMMTLAIQHARSALLKRCGHIRTIVHHGGNCEPRISLRSMSQQVSCFHANANKVWAERLSHTS